MYYYKVDVYVCQVEIEVLKCFVCLDDLLIILVIVGCNYLDVEIMCELENNCQGIFGYVVCWIDQGVGCLKVFDINDVGLMEDWVMLCILVQLLVNWLYYGVVSQQQVMDVMCKMVDVVDCQNVGDVVYCLMVLGFDGVVFQVVCDLVFLGCVQFLGYIELVLYVCCFQVKVEVCG